MNTDESDESDSSLDEPSNARYDFVKIERLSGQTSRFGTYFKCKHRLNGEIFAMKKISTFGTQNGITGETLREISILRHLKHVNIVALVDVFVNELSVVMILEWMTVDLKRYMDQTDSTPDKSFVKSCTYQIAQAMLYCHERRVLHRDLKPSSVWIDKRGVVKVGNFCIARQMVNPAAVPSHEVVTLWYRAPEVLLGARRYSSAIDIWSMGCILSELTTRKPLFLGDSEIDQLFRIFKVLSTPNEDTWPGVSTLRDFKVEFPKWREVRLNEVNIGLDPHGLDLLQVCFFGQSLIFNF
jgi:cyclin-dependent kinase 1